MASVKVLEFCGTIDEPLVHPDMIDLMAKAGVTAAYFGVESGDQSILKAMDKNFNLEKCLPEVLEKLKTFPEKIGTSIEKYRFREALVEFMNLARLGNKYLADTEPWKLKKTDEKRTETIMHIALQIAASLSVLSEPFLPFSSNKLKEMLNLKELNWEDASKNNLKGGKQINKSSLLFTKIEDDTIEQQISKLKT